MSRCLFITLLVSALYIFDTPIAAAQRADNVSHDSTIEYFGTVQDSASGAPLGGATIVLADKMSRRKLKYALTQSDGHFSFLYRRIAGGEISVSNIGYHLKTQVIPENPGDAHRLDVGTIALSPLPRELGEVKIKASAVDYSLNKITYTVGIDSSDKGLSGAELLEKVPLIDVAGKTIYVSGQSNFRILLNGRNSGVMTNNPVAYLKSIPASLIERIEILSDPPEKYRQEGVDKIINIVLVHKPEGGIYTAVSGGVDSRGGYDGGLFMLARTRKLGCTLNMDVDRFNGERGRLYLDNQRIFASQNESMLENGSIENISHTLSPTLEITYALDSLTLISASIEGTVNWTHTKQSIQTTIGTPDTGYAYTSIVDNHSQKGFLYSALDVEHLIGRRKDILTLSGRLNRQYDNLTQSEIDQDKAQVWSTSFASQIHNPGSELTGQLDFEKHILSKDLLDVGIKAVSRFSHPTEFGDSIGTGNSTYRQNVYAAYTSYSYVKTAFSLSFGGSLEKTAINYRNDLATDNFSSSYINGLPYLTLTRQFKKDRSLSLNYRMSEKRPGIVYIDPYVKITSPGNVSFGNPELRPELSNGLSLTYNTFLHKKPLVLSFYVNRSSHAIVEYKFPESDSVMATSYSNAGLSQSIGSTLYYSITFFKKFTVRVNSDLAYQRVSNRDNGLQEHNCYFKIFATLNYKFPQKLSLSLQNFLYSRTITYQGYQGGSPDIMLTLRKVMLKDNLSLSLILHQPFLAGVRVYSYYQDEDFAQQSFTDYPVRYVGLSINYNIGNIAKAYSSRHVVRSIQNDDEK